MKLLSDEEAETVINEESAPKEPKQRRGRRSRLESPVAKDTLQSSLSGVFNTLSYVSRSEMRFVDDDFASETKKLVDFINIFPAARIIVHLLGPISVIGDMIEKLRKIDEKRKKKSATGVTIEVPGNPPFQQKQPF